MPTMNALIREALRDRVGARTVEAYDRTRDANRTAIVAPRDRWPNQRVIARYDVLSDADDRIAIVEFRTSEVALCKRKGCADDPGASHCVHAKAVREYREAERAAALDGRNDALDHRHAPGHDR